MTTQIDLSPLLQAVIGLAAIAITSFGSLVLRALAKRMHVDITTGETALFDAGLAKALSFGVSQATSLIQVRGWNHPDVHSKVLATALTYMVERFPDALAGAGLSADLGDPANLRAITDALTRALPAAFTEAAASPATPSANAPAAAAPISSAS